MDLCVTIIKQGMVAPSGSTPSCALDLSVIDSLPALRCSVSALHVFKHGVPEVGKVIREALSKALFYYYPLAGRLRFSNNLLQVVCSGDAVGAWLVEASADCTLDDVHYFDDAKSIPYHKLLPPQENRDHGLADPLVRIQVTRFGCNGFVVGLMTCHSLLDGVGTAQFVKAVGEMARGAEQPSITPEWGRDFLPARGPPLITLTPDPTQLNNNNPYQVEHATIDLSLDKIKEIKQEFLKWTNGMKTCSTFEIVSALMWRERTRAIKLTESAEIVKLAFYASCRHLFPLLPKGFYGNCFFPVTVTVPSGALTNMSVFQVVKLIKEAKAELPNEFRKWTRTMNNPFEQLAPDYRTLVVVDWDGLGFRDTDYGWGKPVNLVPVQESHANTTPIVVLSSTIPIKAGVLRMKTWCVQQHHIQPLLRNINNVIMILNNKPNELGERTTSTHCVL